MDVRVAPQQPLAVGVGGRGGQRCQECEGLTNPAAVDDGALDSDEIGPYFDNIDMRQQIDHQTKFIASLMGGPTMYGGRSPRDAHVHMFLPAEVFEIRHGLLVESLEEAGVPPRLREKWLALDAKFKNAIVNKSPDECHGRYRGESVIIVPRPAEGAA